jgi:hypothetical protein
MKAAIKSAEEIEGLQPVLPGMPKELNRHVKIAINHMKKRHAALNEQLLRIEGEMSGIREALEALGE